MSKITKLTNIVRTKIHGEEWEPELEIGTIVETKYGRHYYFGFVIESLDIGCVETDVFADAFLLENGGYKEHKLSTDLEYSKILGKPLTLREILLAIHKTIGLLNFTPTTLGYALHSVDEENDFFVKIDLDIDPKDYPEETLESLVELLS